MRLLNRWWLPRCLLMGLLMGLTGLPEVTRAGAPAVVPPGYPRDTLGIFDRLKAARTLGQTSPDSAVREMRALVALSQRARLPRWESRIRYRLGDLFVRAQDQPAEASAEAFAILRLARATADPDPSAEMLGLLLLGDVYFAKADYAEAAKYHRQAYTLAQRFGTIKEQGRAGASLGNSLSSTNPTEAVVLLRRSTDLLLAAGDTITAVSCLTAEVEVLQLLKKLDRAEATAREALRFYTYPILRPEVVGRATLQLYLSQVLLDRSQAASAFAISQQVRQVATEISSKMLEREALQCSAPAAYALGKYREAYELGEKLRKLTEQINSTEVAEQIASLSTRYDADRREARIRALTQQRRLERLATERAATRARWLATATGGLTLALAVFGLLLGLVVRQRRRLATSEANLRRADATKDRLMSIIGHDLRAPAAGLQQAMPLVRYYADHPNPTEQRELADELTQRAQQFGLLLDNLLYWSYSQRNEVQNHPQAVPPAEVLTAAVALYGPLATAKGVDLRTHLAAALPVAWADPVLLATVVRNLTNNAVKFTPSGGQVTVTATATPGGQLRFAVADTGIGMTPAQRAHLFDVAADRSTAGTAGEGGTGLGLLVCHHFVTLLGGRLHVESEPGRGTTFAFEVPAAPVEQGNEAGVASNR